MLKSPYLETSVCINTECPSKDVCNRYIESIPYMGVWYVSFYLTPNDEKCIFYEPNDRARVRALLGFDSNE